MHLSLTNFLKVNLAILIIVIFSFLLRIASVDSMPPALNWDEISHGYNAYSILKTGKDEWGVRLPVIFQAYGDYKLPFYIYLTVLSEFFLGFNELAIRLPSVAAGTLAVAFTYLFVRELFASLVKNAEAKGVDGEKVALISAFLVAINPWSLFLSRGAFEANVAFSLFLAGAYFALKGLNRSTYLFPSIILFGLTVWTYNSYRIFTPLFLIGWIFIYREQLFKQLKNEKMKLFGCVLIALVFFAPMLWQLSNNSGKARYDKVAIIDEGAVNKINEQRADANYSDFVERLLYNKATFFIKTTITNWSSHYSIPFLFAEGGSQYQYNVPKHGLLYYFQLPFLIIGLILTGFYIAKKNKAAMLMLIWFILAPFPAAITRDSPHTLRAITMLPLPMIFSAIGFVYTVNALNILVTKKMGISNLFRQKKLNGVLYSISAVIMLVSLENFLTVYFNDYKNNYSWSWQYGYKEVVEYAKDNYSEYDKIIVTKKYGEPHIFFLSYWPWDPENFVNDPNLIRYEQSNWYWVDRFDKFYFANDWDIPTRSDLDFKLERGAEFDCDFTKCLLITSPGQHQQDWKLLKTINFLDGEPAFEILDNTGR